MCLYDGMVLFVINQTYIEIDVCVALKSPNSLVDEMNEKI